MGEVERPLGRVDEVDDPAHDLLPPAGRRRSSPDVEHGRHLRQRLAAARIGQTHNQYDGSPLRQERLALPALAQRARRARRRGGGLPNASPGSVHLGAAHGEARLRRARRSSSRCSESSGSRRTCCSGTLSRRRIRIARASPNRTALRRGQRSPQPGRFSTRSPGRGSDKLLLGVGRVAQRELGGPYIRHPSHGGATGFRENSRRMPDHLNVRRNTILLAAIMAVNSCLFQLAAALACSFRRRHGHRGAPGTRPCHLPGVIRPGGIAGGSGDDRFGRAP